MSHDHRPEPLTVLVDTWVTGFGLSRRVPVQRAAGVTEVEVGVPGRRLELVLVEPDDALVSAVLDRVSATDDLWSTIITYADRPRDLPPLVVEKLTGERLMTVVLSSADQGGASGAAHPLPLDLLVDGDRAVVRILDGGIVAAQGQVAVVGGDAIFDRISTHDSYRRRGLGTTVVGALTGWAIAQGAERGILAASSDGQALYATLGWRPVAAMTTYVAIPSA